MKKISTLLLCAALAMSVWGVETPFDYNGLHFQTNDAEDAATLLKSDDYKTLTEVAVPDSAFWTAGGKMLPVKYMEDKCFENCTLLEKATSGKALDRPYGDYFKGCTALKYMVIRHTNGTDAWVPDKTLQQLETLEFAPGVTNLPINYFNNGQNLKVVKLYNSNNLSWGWYFTSFDNMANLERVEINDDSNSLMIENSAVYSKKGETLYLLPQKSGVTSFAVREGCTDIESEALKNNTALESVTIPSSVSWIGSYAFMGCTALTSIDLSQCAITRIHNHCFYDCTSLATITLSDKITGIGQDALTNTAYVNNAANWKDGFLYLGDILLQTKSDALSGNITIKDGTRVLSYNSLKYLNVTGITLPASVKYIDDGALSGCSELTTLDLSHVISIGSTAFWSDSKLETVTLGPDISSIGERAFQNCSNLKHVYIPRGSVPYSSECPYQYLTQAFTVHIPVGTKPIYSASPYYSTCAANMSLADDLLVPGAQYTVSGLQYKILSVDDKTAAVTWEKRKSNEAAYVSLSGDITVPEKVTLGSEEYTVTEIDAYAFYCCDDVTSLSLPKSIKKIGEYACYGSDNLATVTVASGGALTEVGASAFEDNKKLTSVTLPSTVEIIADKAFKLARLTTFPMPTSLKKIGKEAFYCCYNLPDFVLSEGIEEIGYRAFDGTNSVTRAYLPSTVKSLGAIAFSGSSYRKWEVHPDNKYFWADEDGILYSKDKTVIIGTFIYNSSISTVVIPETVTSMYERAFASNEYLQSVVFPAGLKDIPEEAFVGCRSLRKLDLRHVQTIGEEAFSNCTMVDTVLLGADLRSIGDQGLANIWSSSSAGTASRPAFYFMCEAVDVPDIKYYSLLSLGKNAPEDAKKFLVPLESAALYRKTNYWNRTEGLKGYTYWTITANKPAGGTVTGGEGMILEGETITLTATAKRGYKFAKWSDGDVNATRDITVAAEHANLVLEAQFDEIPVEVGGTFQDETKEGVLVTYKVLTKAPGDMTVQVGNCIDPNVNPQAIDKSTAGELTIPDSAAYLNDKYEVVQIDQRALFLCNSLTAIHLPNTIKVLKSQAVTECTSVTDINIPSGLESTGISNYTYMNIASITIPGSLKYIGYGFLTGNSKLTAINGWNPSQFERVGGAGSTALAPFFTNKANVDTIDGFVYAGDILLRSVYLYSAETMAIKEGTRVVCGEIGSNTKSNCKHIEFPASVEAIGGGALFYYPVLETCTIKAVTPPLVYCGYDVDIEEDATYLRVSYSSCWSGNIGTTPANVKYYVPKAALATYQASDKWNMLDLHALEDSSTDMEQAEGGQAGMKKIIREGQILILRGGKAYTLTGQEVK